MPLRLLRLTLLCLVAGACGGAPGSGDDGSPRLTREQAIARANEEEGRPQEASAIDAELTSGEPWAPAASEYVWVVDYHCIPVPIYGPAGRPGPPFEIADWGVVIGAESGRFIVAGSSGDPNNHCPHD